MLKQRIITALVLGAGVILSIYFMPDWLWALLISVVILLGVHEWCALVKIGKAGQGVISLASILPVLFVGMQPAGSLVDLPFFLGAIYLISACFWLLSVPTFLYFRIEPVGWYWRFFAAMLMMVASGMALLELRRADPSLLLAALLVVCIADICAFFAGRRFGKHKLAPEISPGKTWEGVAGAVVGVLAFYLLTWAFVPAIHAVLNPVVVVLMALVSVVLCVVGDLYESMLKREARVKDSGTLLPGHGGVLDRIDAMLAFLPCAGAVLLFVQLIH